MLLATAPVRAEEAPRPILVLGDSVLDWFSDERRAAPNVLAATLQRRVFNASVSGARLVHPNLAAQFNGLDIRGQYRPGPWSWVVIEGGANDLFAGCACADCSEVLNRLVTPDGGDGALPKLMARATADGARVLLLGYYEMPDASDELAVCENEFDELDRRQRRAAALSGAVFASPRDVIASDDLDAYDEDLLHPSLEGARRIGKLMADAISQAE